MIREDVVPYFNSEAPYDEAVIQGCLMAGAAFKIDAHTVHQIIHRNVHEDSDAYTYLKPLLRRQDGYWILKRSVTGTRVMRRGSRPSILPRRLSRGLGTRMRGLSLLNTLVPSFRGHMMILRNAEGIDH